MKNFLIISLILPCALLLSSCGSKYRKMEGMIWNTSFHITYDSDRDLSDSVYATLKEIDKSLNVFDESSLVSKANTGDSIRVDRDFLNVYEMSRKIHACTSGAFDPTLGPLIDAWGFGKGHTASADTLRLDSLLAITGLNRTKIENNILFKENPLIRFNFSAIAKGYACDRVAEMLRRNGAGSCLVEIGGEIACHGQSPSGENWRISIDKPIFTDSVVHESQCVISITDSGIATSGNYRNFHKSGDRIFGHTISSKTGRPVQTDVLSATVIAPTAMEADALATSMMALGSKESAALAEKLGVATLLILNDGTIWLNDAFSALIVQD